MDLLDLTSLCWAFGGIAIVVVLSLYARISSFASFWGLCHITDSPSDLRLKAPDFPSNCQRALVSCCWNAKEWEGELVCRLNLWRKAVYIYTGVGVPWQRC